jgi:hypothetical protein
MQDSSFTVLEQVVKYRTLNAIKYSRFQEHSFLFRILYCLVLHYESLLKRLVVAANGCLK